MTKAAEPASVGAVFDAASAAGVRLRAVLGSVPSDITLRPEAAGRLRDRLAEGLVAILPEHPVLVDGLDRTGWRLVDPATGRAIDELDDGRGVAIDQYAVTLRPGQAGAEAIKVSKLACMVGGAAALAALMFDLTAGYAWAYAIEHGVQGAEAQILLAINLIALGGTTAAGGLMQACLGG